ncbi:uncharacterized protein MYCFIDRAFT_42017 [Pseudocercospora fijiensis CIRAD86]|uniref:Alpha-1,2-mannosyltransferase n=1 Tax=Pseudocercospora fijiensis (strain CIRAD86) TaxID=383855 RepID=M2Z4I0_PSEFD|nr:uncharacterized protein MYCFIDRAFT_42017 [Pseudocercospora fijiensis CIRAD86]EME84710.1 hypothetical protein MYCFIDRAFT_42017 [Pseudocercospora fijiensis CIRAD86]
MFQLPLYLLPAAIIGSIVYLILNTKARNGLLSKLGAQARTPSTVFTPPRELSLEKQGLPPNRTTLDTSSPAYGDAFPPSRRHIFAKLAADALKGPGRSAKELAEQPIDYSRLTPDKSTPTRDEFLHHFTATGFTVGDVQRLGDFPDYATLSGVPLPEPFEEFRIDTALPRPYRPFRWAYHQTIALTKMESDWWLELDRDYRETIRLREELFEKHGPAVIQTLPGSEMAAKELMEMCLQFLCARYPHYFSLDAANLVLRNRVLDTQTDLQSTPPMQVLLHNIPEDFAIMIRDPETGIYSFRGGIIMSSLGWTLGSKIGLKLHEIHAPIPDYKEKMQFSMDRYFSKKPTEKPIQRGSWGLEIDKPLFMPPGDPRELHRESQNPEHGIDRIHLRVDWQTLRRLPLSGAVVFNFKALFTPVTEFRDEPYVPSLVLKVLREGKKNLMEYKGTWHTEHVVIPYLEMCEREQREKGLIEDNWQPRTLDEAPFYPGWEAKWHRQQGF